MFEHWKFRVSIIAWVVVWAFWLSLTHRFHPTFSLALIVTTILVSVYAAAAYCNHLLLLPRLWSQGLHLRYAVWLAFTMALLTAVALAVIRVSYFMAFGPDTDPNGVYKHYAIDLFGMLVHVGLAALVVWVTKWRNAYCARNNEITLR